MAYRIEIGSSAKKELQSLPPKQRRQIGHAIDGLAENPRGPKTEKLKGRGNEYRIRVGDYRVIFRIVDQIITIYVIGVKNRKDAYR